MAFRKIGVLLGLLLSVGACRKAVDEGVFFDDFNYTDTAGMTKQGWIVRDKQGDPGPHGASWGPGTVVLVDDSDQAGNRLVRLIGENSGSVETTRQAQICHARKYLEGTYAARVRFSDRPVSGPDGDVVVQTFYTVSPLRFPYDPLYSEVDWEYLPNGGWGDPKTRLYGTSWQTSCQVPWDAYNQSHQLFRELGGWHVLVMQIADGKVRYFLDGEPFDTQGGRNYPVVPMSLNASLWFPVNGLVGDKTQRTYHEDVDWVFHARNRVLSPQEVESAVKSYRRAGTSHLDTVPPAKPPLPSPCDF
jgi:hypothetical protein